MAPMVRIIFAFSMRVYAELSSYLTGFNPMAMAYTQDVYLIQQGRIFGGYFEGLYPLSPEI